MANRPYITAMQVRYSVLWRRAVRAQLAAEAEVAQKLSTGRSRRTKPAGPGERSEQVSTSSSSQEG